MSAEPIQTDRSVGQVLQEWPRDRPLGVLWSGGGSARSRWTLFAETSGEQLTTMCDEVPRWPRVMEGEVGNVAVRARSEDKPPFVPGWLGFVSYELGRVLEPRATAGRHDDLQLPLMQWQRFDRGLAFDHERGRWWGIGAGAGAIVDDLCGGGIAPSFALGLLKSRTGRAAFESAVSRAIEHIRAGDIYQVNLTHGLEGAFTGSSRSLFAALANVAMPWYGAYLEVLQGCTCHAIASVSPELFLSYDPRSRRIETRPMKGTRAVGAAADTVRDELHGSEKDRAELAMIVDLMRNDLGRVCEERSIRVEDARAIERHGSLLQTTATVSGTLSRSRSLVDLLRATFPGGSITGAPKIRAMQIIEKSEPLPRGAYCGSVGYVGDDGSMRLNIAIRTAVVGGQATTAQGAESSVRERDRFEGATMLYAVGAGIVADSDPVSEWEETLAKASVIAKLASIVDAARPR